MMKSPLRSSRERLPPRRLKPPLKRRSSRLEGTWEMMVSKPSELKSSMRTETRDPPVEVEVAEEAEAAVEDVVVPTTLTERTDLPERRESLRDPRPVTSADRKVTSPESATTPLLRDPADPPEDVVLEPRDTVMVPRELTDPLTTVAETELMVPDVEDVETVREVPARATGAKEKKPSKVNPLPLLKVKLPSKERPPLRRLRSKKSLSPSSKKKSLRRKVSLTRTT